MASLRTVSLLLVGSLLTTLLPAQGSSYHSIANGCAGSLGTPVLEADGSSLPIFGDRFRTRLSKAADGPAIGIIGLSTNNWAGYPLPLDLSTIGMPGCLLHTDIRYSLGLVVNNGEATWDIDLPNLPVWLGRSFYQQVLVLDPTANPAGAILSNANQGVIDVEKPSPLVKIVFPPAKSLTDEYSISVRGTAVDPDGITDLRVNGFPASTRDGFRNWQVRVPLPQVVNRVVASATDSLGNVSLFAAEVEVVSRPYLTAPERVTFGESNGELLVMQGKTASLLGVDYATGESRIIFSDLKGSGPVLRQAGKIVVDGDRALILSPFPKGLYSVDLDTGDRSLVASDATSWGLLQPIDFVVDGNRALFTDADWEAVISVDLTNGKGTFVSVHGIGTGTAIPSPLGIVTDGVRAYITETDQSAVVAINLATGDRSVLTGFGVGGGPELTNPGFLAMDGNRLLVTNRLPAGLIAVDPVSGNRTAVSGEAFDPPPFLKTTGTGPALTDAHDVAVLNGLAVLSDPQLGSVFAVDLADGRRSEFTAARIGSGRPMLQPRDLALDGEELLVLDVSSPPVIHAVDLKTGDRRLVSGDGVGGGPSLSNPQSIVSDGGNIYVTNGPSSPALLRVNRMSGDRQVVSDARTGIGPQFSPGPIALDGDRAFLLSGGVMSVDFNTGDRAFVSNYMRGGGPELGSLIDLALHGGELLVATQHTLPDWPYSSYSMLRIDLGSGDRSLVSGPGMGVGTELRWIKSIAVQGSRAYMTSWSSSRQLGFVDLASGDRVDPPFGGRGPIVARSTGLVLKGSLAFFIDEERLALVAFDLETGERVILSRRNSTH